MVLSKIYSSTATVSGVCPAKTDIIPAQSGYRIVLTQVVAANKEGSLRALSLSEGDNAIAPQFTLGGSGTLIWDSIGGPEGLPLERGSGLLGCLDLAGEVDVTAYYKYDDQSDPITKEEARTASFSNVTVTRTPNRFGGQSKT